MAPNCAAPPTRLKRVIEDPTGRLHPGRPRRHARPENTDLVSSGLAFLSDTALYGEPMAGDDVATRLVGGYVEGWKAADSDLILDTLEPDCVVIESHGPTYRGRDQVKRWIE